MNAFTTARPRGPDIDVPAVRTRKAEHAPKRPIRALDVNGRPVVDIAPRATAFHFLSAMESAAQQERRRKIVGPAPGGR